jgi:hypothetical protein
VHMQIRISGSDKDSRTTLATLAAEEIKLLLTGIPRHPCQRSHSKDIGERPSDRSESRWVMVEGFRIYLSVLHWACGNPEVRSWVHPTLLLGFVFCGQHPGCERLGEQRNREGFEIHDAGNEWTDACLSA